MLKPDQYFYLANIFKRFDKDGNGTICLHKVKKGLYDIENGEALFDRMISSDIDGDGMIMVGFGKTEVGTTAHGDILDVDILKAKILVSY